MQADHALRDELRIVREHGADVLGRWAHPHGAVLDACGTRVLLQARVQGLKLAEPAHAHTQER